MANNRMIEQETQVTVLFHRIGPYHFARLRAAGKRLSITAVEMSSTDDTYAWEPVHGAEGFERVTLFEGADSHSQPADEVSRRVKDVLERTKPAAVVINGWSDAGALGALKWCVHTGTPAIMMSESTEWDEKRVFWKEWIKSRVVRMCSAALAGGSPHLDYLVKLGMPKYRIFMGYDAVDNAYFVTKADEARHRQSEIRKRLKLPERYFLASARFIEKKNFPRLLQAYSLYRQRSSGDPSSIAPSDGGCSLVILGDGPLKSDLCHLIVDLNLSDYVQMPGFVQYPNLPAYYGLATAFVHASTTEQWGLVVNEAMASGLPVLVSNRCGCAQDLVQDGVNGFTFDPYNVKQLADLMVKISTLPVCQSLGEGGPVLRSLGVGGCFPLSTFGAASREIIANWGPDRFAKGLHDAAEVAIANPMPKPGLMDRLLLKLLLSR